MRATCAIAVCLFAACQARPRTEVLLVVDAEPGVRAAVARLELRILAAPRDRDEWREVLAQTFGDGDLFFWPVTLGLVPRGGDASRRYDVRAVGRSGANGDIVTQARVLSGYVKGQTRELRILLEDSCLGVACEPDETCHAGGCRDAELVDPSDLPIPGQDAGAGGRDAGADGSDARVDGGDGHDGMDGAVDGNDAGDASGDARVDAPCLPGETRPCGLDAGECQAGTERCFENQWTGECDGDIGPRAERCNGIDEDCDDVPDEDDPEAWCGDGELCGKYEGELVCYSYTSDPCSDDPCPAGYECRLGADGMWDNCSLCPDEDALCRCKLCIRAP